MKIRIKQGRVKSFFSAESTIQKFAQKKETVCRPVGTQFNGCYIQAAVKNPTGVMIWAIFPVIAQLDFSFYQSEQQ